MNRMLLNNRIPFNNILYIGDEPKACLGIIEKFNASLLEIQNHHKSWFTGRKSKHKVIGNDKLQNHIHYHFEGGIAVFKFRNDDDLPAHIRIACIDACRDIAIEETMMVF